MKTHAKVTIVAIFVLAIVFAIAVFSTKMISTATGGGAKILDRSILVVDVSKMYPETVRFEFNPFTFDREISFYKLITAVHNAATDKNIDALVIKGTSTLGLSRNWELIEAVAAVRKAGKPVYAYCDGGNIPTILLAKNCDTVYASPLASFYIPGISISTLYLKKTFDKLGIGFDVVRAGNYKNAFESFVSEKMSTETAESYGLLLDDIYNAILSDWAEYSGTTPESCATIIDRAIIDADEAKELGIVTEIGYWNDFINKLSEGNKNRILSVTKYATRMKEPETDDKIRIALVTASGNITMAAGKFDSQSSITPERYAKIIRELAEDSLIDAIVLRVDSPGGSAVASDIIHNALIYARDKKMLVVSQGSVAASGGYYLSMPAKEIFSTPYTITGSIGVISLLPHFGKLYEKIGANPQVVKRGKYADMLSGSHPLTDDERAIFQEYTNRTYEIFVTKTAEGRDTTYDWIDEIGQGRVWTGVAAESLSLVDGISSLWATLRYVEGELGVEVGKHATIIEKPKAESFFDIAAEMNASLRTWVLPKALAEQAANYEFFEAVAGEPMFLMLEKIDID